MFHPRLEMLEDRTLPSTVHYLVTDPSDNAGSANDVTLRYAVTQAILHNQTAVIDFAPSLAGQTITLVHIQTYPGLLGPTGFAIGGTTNVTIDGSDAPGLTIDSPDLRLFGVYRTAKLTLDNLILEGGKATASSGEAIYDSGKLTVDDCTFENNTAGSGGAILVHTDTPQFPASATITDCTFTNNSALFNGGAIFVAIDSSLTVSGSNFNGNSATTGGGIYCLDGTVNLTNSTFADNSASGSIASSGGGIYNVLGTLTISDCTFSGNSATGFGGGICDDTGVFILNNTIVANSASGGDLYEATPLISTVSGSNDLIGDGSFLYLFNDSISGNAGLDPHGLQNNGGPTETIALLAGSQAINAGNNALIPSGVTTDQRGAPRITGENVDIGAYEYVPPVVTTTNLTSSTNPSLVGQSVTFTATVSASQSISNGTVTFFIDGTAAATEELVDGSASFSTSALATGTHAITAFFNGFESGFTMYESSSSTVLSQRVNALSVSSPLPSLSELPFAPYLLHALHPLDNSVFFTFPTTAPATNIVFTQPSQPLPFSATPSATYELALKNEVSGGMPSEIDSTSTDSPSDSTPTTGTQGEQAAFLDLIFAVNPI